jgi:LysM repeat protein
MTKLLFLSILTCTACASLLASPVDSLRLETINGKQFIIHQIDAKETLYSISRRYGVQVTVILESNPTSKEGLGAGQLLKVPYTPKPKTKVEVMPSSSGQITHVVAAKETLFSISKQFNVSIDDLKKWNNLTDNALSTGQELIVAKKETLAPAPRLNEIKSLSSTHTVAAKETMYSIARQYGITVQQLKEWNSLQDNELKIGQMVLITQPKYSTAPKQVVTIPQTVNVSTEVVAPAKIKISESVIGTDEVKEGGYAEVMEGTEGNRKYLALHRTIKPGTILKVRSENTNHEVFVRISGALPSTAGSDVIMQVSKSAFDRLGSTEAKFRIEVTYYK